MKIYRTYDGRLFDISQPLSQFQGRDDLFDAVSLTTGIPSDDIICMTKTGQQINEDILDDMQDVSAQSKDEDAAVSQPKVPRTASLEKGADHLQQEFYVFHRQFLYTDLEGLVAELEEMPELEPAVQEAEVAHPPTPRSLTSLINWCDHLMENVVTHDGRSVERLEQLSIIQRSTTIALSNLLSHSGSVRETALSLQTSASKELTRMQGLLNGHETDLRILSLVHINPKLLPAPDPSKGKPKERTLGDYVSPSKMGAVYQACNSVHNDLEENLRLLQYSETQMNDDTEGLRNEVHGTSIMPSQETYEESRQALARAKEVHEFIKASCMPDDQGWSAAAKLAEDDNLMRKVDEAVGELILLDEVSRESLRRLTADKNDMVSRSLHLLGDISSLQSDYADLGIDLTRLDEEFKSNRVDGFRHLARLKNMLWAYGSTLIEIHRRNKFEAMFLNRGQALAEVMANLSESERRRRADFRSQVVGALPWEIKGMEGNTSNLEISAGKDKQGEEIDVQQSDVDDLFQSLDGVRDKMTDKTSSDAVEEIKASLKLLMSRLDEAEAEFVRFVEVGLLGKSEDDSDSENDSYSQRRKANGNGSLFDKSKSDREMQELRLQHGERERALAEAHDVEMTALQAELSRLNLEHRHLESALEHEKSQHEETRKQLDSRVADAEVEAARRMNMEDEVSRLRRDVEDARRAEMEMKAEINEEIDRANDLEAHLHDLQVELEEAKEARTDASSRMDALLSKDSSAEKQLSLAQERIDELSNQLSLARAEERKAREAQYEIEVTRDKVLRNYRAEADGDRAILEENLRSQRVELDQVREKLRKKDREVGEFSESVKSLQEQLAAAEREEENLLRQLEGSKEARLEAEMARRHVERNVDALVDSARPMMRRIVELHNSLRDAPVLASSSSKSTVKTLNESEATPSNANASADQEEVEMRKQKAMDAFQAAGDTASLEVIMELINSFTRSALIEQVTSKLETLPQLCKKWIRAYKHSSEKSQKQQALLREKLTFRNFGIGDLALFLPTRNNSGKPWAAFNINFPHFFLNFTGSRENEQLRDVLQNKEWIVARILKIESRVATASKSDDADAASGNPFQLSEGVKFYLLDVEGWNNANSNVVALPRRKTANASLTLAGDRSVDSPMSAAAAPILKRWDTMPHADSALKGGASQAVREAGDASTSPQGKSIDKEAGLTSPDAAILSTSSPVISGTRDLSGGAPNLTSSRASSPSGIALSLRNRSLSPEMNRIAAKSANEIVEAGFTRWPTRKERQEQRVRSEASSMKGQGSPPKTEPSSESSRRGVDRAAPAFGRRKKMTVSSASGGYGTAMIQSRSAGGPLSPPLGLAKTSQQMMPIGMVQRTMEAGQGMPEDPPNPFSASPAPNGGVADMRDYFTARRTPSSRLRPNSGDDEIDLPPNAVRGSNTRRESSSSSVASLLRPRSMLASPRVRAAATLSPSSETAQGQHTLQLQPGSPSQGVNRSAADAASKSSTVTPVDTLPRSISSTPRRMPSSSSVSSWAPTWSLGRRTGTKAVEQSTSESRARDSLLSASQSLRRLADGKD